MSSKAGFLRPRGVTLALGATVIGGLASAPSVLAQSVVCATGHYYYTYQCGSGTAGVTVAANESLQMTDPSGTLVLDQVVSGNISSQGSIRGDTTTIQSSDIRMGYNQPGSELIFDQATDGTYAGNVFWGTLVKAGSGALTLSSNHSVHGYRVEAGKLIGDVRSLGSKIDVASGATVVFNQATDATYTHALTGNTSATLTKEGAGRLVLSGNGSFGGNVQVKGGALAGTATHFGSSLITVDSGKTFEFAQQADATTALRGLIVNGEFIKSGAGKLTLGGNYSQMSLSNTSVTAGELVVQGGTFTTMNVASGARLTSTGNTVLGTLSVQGTFAPQSYSGYTVNDLFFAPGATYEVRVNGNSSDNVTSLGNIDLNGVKLHVVPQMAFMSQPYTTTILTASNGSISGNFASTTHSSATIKSSLDYTGNQVQLTVEQVRTIRQAVTTPSAAGPAAALDRLASGGNSSSGMTALLGQLYTLDERALEQAVETLSGENTGSTASMGSASTAALTGGIAQRMADLRFSGGGGAGGGNSLLTQMAFAGGNADMAMDRILDLAPPPRIGQADMDAMGAGMSHLSGKQGIWMRGVAGWGVREASGSFSRQTYNMQGLIVGADTPLSERLTAGVAFGYATGSSETDDDTLEGGNTTLFTSGYGGWTSGNWRVDGSLGFARHKLDSERRIRAGTIALTANGEHDAYEVMGDIGATYRIPLDKGVVLEPLAGLSLSHLWEEAWSETGAGAANLQFDETTRFNATSRLGAGVWRTFDVGSGYSFTPQAEAMWLHALGDREADLTAAFAEAPNAPWKVGGRKDPMDSVMIGLSGTVETGDWTLSAGWAGRFAEDSADHAVRLRAGLTW